MSRLTHLGVLPLHVFVKRQQVVKLYRRLLKAALKLHQDSLQADVTRQIKLEFRKNKDLSDKVAIRNAIQSGHRQLKQVEDMIGVSTRSADSWLSSSDQVDVRGRVGDGWPWRRV